ncbi:MAG: ribosomal RNA small subunit methyltransferase A [Candidatus Kerfeldbacteria bacterium]|nr:ribosomal RNA small subunit methyltransferase A [Candidatus Kerfeldbacteria bacterium]
MAFSRNRRVQNNDPHDVTDPAVIRELCRKFGIRPTKKFSQNFCIDPQPLDAMIAAAGLRRGDRVLEVGPGFGVLTERLLAAGADVTACEIDERLVAALLSRFSSATLRVVHADFFRWYREHADELAGKPFSIVANLPYAVSSHFFKSVLAHHPQPETIVVMLQKEVAERISAKPGKMNMLALSVQYYGVPRVHAVVPRQSFWPAPDVDSAVASVTNIHPGGEDERELFRLARMAFVNRRKQLHNSLASGLHCSDEEALSLCNRAGINPATRPQDVGLEDWRRLARCAEEFELTR